MGRKLLAIITAMITAVGIIWIAFMVSTAAAPFYPKNLEYMTSSEVNAWANSAPAMTFAIVLVGYVLAGLAAGFIATKMGRRWSPGMSLAVACGVLLTVGELLTTPFWPQPLWFIVASILAFVPSAIAGYKLAHRVGHTHMITA